MQSLSSPMASLSTDTQVVAGRVCQILAETKIALGGLGSGGLGESSRVSYFRCRVEATKHLGREPTNFLCSRKASAKARSNHNAGDAA